MKFSLVIFFVFINFVTVAVVIPQKPKKDDGPDCGARSVFKPLKPRPIHKEASFLCEMCLDLVEIAEQNAECDEAYVDSVLDQKCDSYFHTGFMDKACREMCDQIMHELEQDTDQDPGKVCTKITKTDCHYFS